MDSKLELIAEEEKITLADGFWNDPKKAEVVLKSIQEKKSWTNAFTNAEVALADIEVLFEFYQADESMVPELNLFPSKTKATMLSVI